VLPTSSASAASTTTRATIVSFRDENRGLSNAYRIQIGGDTLADKGINSPGDHAAQIAQKMNGPLATANSNPFIFCAICDE